MEDIPRSKILNGPLGVGVAGVLLHLESPSSLDVRLFTGNLGVYHHTQSTHNGDDFGLTQYFAGVPTDVSEDVVMAGNSHAVGMGVYLQDMVVSFRHYAHRTADPIPVSPPGGSGSSRESTDSYLVTVDTISAGKKCGSVRYPLVLVGNLSGVLQRTSFYQAVEENGPPLFAAFFVCDDGGSVGEPFVALEDFLGQVRICDVWFIKTWYKPEKAVSPVEKH